MSALQNSINVRRDLPVDGRTASQTFAAETARGAIYAIIVGGNICGTLVVPNGVVEISDRMHPRLPCAPVLQTLFPHRSMRLCLLIKRLNWPALEMC